MTSNCSNNINVSNVYDLVGNKVTCVVQPMRVNLIPRDRTSVTATIRTICHP